ncbi:peptidoglycan DD-metalloendopeptidase family protein [candidate division TA06 bacterium]|nr:peptidoglycan DD-metalloendopeptidase family protein [candidate division TA06 bacterium]
MKQKRYLSFMIVPEGGERTFRGRISYPVLRTLLASALVLFTLFLFFSLRYGKVSLQAMRGKEVEERVRSLEEELRRVEDLEREVAQLRAVKDQIEGMLGVSHNPGSMTHKRKEVPRPSIWPVKGKVTREFSQDHSGIDIAVPLGSPVWATEDGIVAFAGWDEELGHMVELDHQNGLKTVYGHNSEVLVEKGSQVKKGDVIAFSGSSGRSTAPHLHYEILLKGMSINPKGYLEKQKNQNGK